MKTVPVLQALSWGDESPLRTSGEVDMAALAHGLARVDCAGGRRPRYTRAQHAVVVSEAVEALASLNPVGRRDLALHAWLAGVRNADLRDRRAGGAKNRVGIRTMDVEAWAAALGRRIRSEAAAGGVEGLPPGAAPIEARLKSLGALDAPQRRRLALYGLLADTVHAGLGTAVAEAALQAAGLGLQAPVSWVEALRIARRMAEAAVRRDLPGTWPDGDRAFPATGARIERLDPGEAQKRWLSRYRALTGHEKEDRS